MGSPFLVCRPKSCRRLNVVASRRPRTPRKRAGTRLSTGRPTLVKKRGLLEKPTSAGRVSGFGTSVKFGEYYKEENKKRREKKTQSTVQVLAKQVEDLKASKLDEEAVNAMVDRKVEEKLRALLPPQLWEGLAKWNAAGQVGPIKVPSVGGSNSSHIHGSPDMVTPPATIAAAAPQPMELEGPVSRPPVRVDIDDRPVVVRASPLDKLNALTVVIIS